MCRPNTGIQVRPQSVGRSRYTSFCGGSEEQELVEEEEEAEEEEEETLARSVTGGCLVGEVGQGQQVAGGQEMKMTQEVKKTAATGIGQEMMMLSRPITQVLAGGGRMQKGRPSVGMCPVRA